MIGRGYEKIYLEILRKKINRFVVDLSLVAYVQEFSFLAYFLFQHMSNYLFDYLSIFFGK